MIEGISVTVKCAREAGYAVFSFPKVEQFKLFLSYLEGRVEQTQLPKLFLDVGSTPEGIHGVMAAIARCFVGA